MINKKRKAYSFGTMAEIISIIYLMLKGYRVLTRRFKTPVGEVDIVAKQKKTLVMVEVKARKNKETEEVITSRQMDRIMNAAALFIAKKPEFATFPVRMDLIIIHPWKLPRHIKNAWERR